jgi:hypothetical protein
MPTPLVPLPGTVADITSHAGDDGAPIERLPEQGVDVVAVLGGEPRQRLAQIVGDRELGGESPGLQFAETPLCR